jgi:hypothetical protein
MVLTSARFFFEVEIFLEYGMRAKRAENFDYTGVRRGVEKQNSCMKGGCQSDATLSKGEQADDNCEVFRHSLVLPPSFWPFSAL